MACVIYKQENFLVRGWWYRETQGDAGYERVINIAYNEEEMLTKTAWTERIYTERLNSESLHIKGVKWRTRQFHKIGRVKG